MFKHSMRQIFIVRRLDSEVLLQFFCRMLYLGCSSLPPHFASYQYPLISSRNNRPFIRNPAQAQILLPYGSTKSSLVVAEIFLDMSWYRNIVSVKY